MSQKLRVLLVEDEPLITFLFQDLLDGTEFSVVATMTCSGPVLDYLARDAPDLAIVDLMLADGPCIPLIEKLLEMRVPTVVVSGHEDGEGYANRDGACFLSKPFYSERLLAALRSMVSGRQRPAAPAISA